MGHNLNSEKPIGIFDSGVGGLTVVQEVIKTLPNENIIYFGDTARVPYGSKTKETITKYSRQIMNFLLSKDVKAVIIACNTVCANSYDILVNEFDIPIIEVISNGVSLCLELPNISNIGIIGTEGTVASGAYEKMIKSFNKDINVYSKACPLFVPLVEEGWTDNDIALMSAKIYLEYFADKNLDALILGCTHYPLLYNTIKKVIQNTNIINPAEQTAKKMFEYLTKNNCMNTEHRKFIDFYVSDNSNKFDVMSKLVLKESYKAEVAVVES